MSTKNLPFEIRPTVPGDLQDLRRIYAAARAFMKATGNPNQWGDIKPLEADLLSDMALGNGYLILQDGRPVGAFALIFGEDPTYGRIDDGAWLDDQKPYATIHRMGSDGTCHGVLKAAIDYAFCRIDNVRIDTHEDNRVMQHLVTKYGFRRCGIIYLKNGDPRIAYQKLVEKTP